jgi:hypothetical protein
MTEPYDGATPTDNPDIWENENGFFFVDETEGLNGPFSTAQDALIALDNYVEYLNNGPKAVNKTSNLPQCNVKYYGG